MKHLDEIPHLSGHEIRTFWIGDTPFFSLVDLIEVLEISASSRRYWSDLKRKLKQEGFEVYDKIVQLKLPAPDGKFRETDCGDMETCLRLIQSIPSPKVEDAKQWLAAVGTAILEGRSPYWYRSRENSKKIRKLLTDEWLSRGIHSNLDFAMLTDLIHLGAFEMTTADHKKLKSLTRQNLRDHLSATELAITMLGEATTLEIAKGKDAQGLGENVDAAKEGGEVAGNARRDIEKRTGKKVANANNFLKRLSSKKNKNE